MKDLDLMIVHPLDGSSVQVSLPEELTTNQAIQDLIEGDFITDVDADANGVKYKMKSKSLGVDLPPDNTLAKTGVVSGDTLILRSAAAAG